MNNEHVEILKRGVDVWNSWRREHAQGPNSASAYPDFRDADLSEMNLRGADFEHADLTGANLQKSNLSFANLACANLSKANLHASTLDWANISNRSVRKGTKPSDASWSLLISEGGAILVGADLSRSHLSGTDLTNANLMAVNLRSASLLDVRFSNTNLSTAFGLEACNHLGPSHLDFLTLSKSWPLPLPFLRGCGLPDILIDYLPSLLNEPIHFYSCFISYSARDYELASRLYNDLQGKGVRCWFAPKDLKIGDRIRTGIDESIRLHDKLLLILSEHSVASDWVEQEVETALERERKEKRLVLFPVRLDNAVMEIKSGWPALIRNTRNIADMQEWRNDREYQAVFNRLLHDLKDTQT